jgi:alpha-glucoside transport system permease protein
MLSLRNKTGTQSAAVDCRPGEPCWGTFDNYRYALTDSEMTQALRNNALWLLFMVPGTVAAGLLFAVVTERVRYERLAKTIVFLPMAISFVGASIIWKFVYALESGAGAQIGVLNAIIAALGRKPIPWLTSANWMVNNVSLWIVGVWLWAGFCMTIISAALKAVPEEILEAARVDGASEWQVFWRIMFPIILPTITVVITTMVINILKVFDIVFVMTGGLNGTEVIANRMFKFIVTNQGRSMAIAVLLIALTIPIMIINVRRFREQEAIR